MNTLQLHLLDYTKARTLIYSIRYKNNGILDTSRCTFNFEVFSPQTLLVGFYHSAQRGFYHMGRVCWERRRTSTTCTYCVPRRRAISRIISPMQSA